MKLRTLVRLSLLAIVMVTITSISIISFPLNYFYKRTYHWLSRIWATLLIWAGGARINTIGLSNIEANTSYVIVSNHTSLFDIPIVLSTFRNEIKMMAKKELLYVPFLGCSLLAGQYIIIDRDNKESAFKIIRKAKKVLKNNRSLLLFPEGTRSYDGKVADFKKGAFVIAKSLRFPILPISIYGANKLMEKKSFKLKPGKVYLKISKPIDIKHLSKEENKNLMGRVHSIITKNLEEMEKNFS